MPEFLREGLLDFQSPAPLLVLVRLVVAMVLGALVALVYRVTRPAFQVVPSFTATLVLLAILIAMVTQVIGDNVARAFALVGALSIVRFRTIVRDTQDTAYVIFAVGVGMAVGAGNYWVAVGGILVVAIASYLMKRGSPATPAAAEEIPFDLQVRLAVGIDPVAALGPALDAHVRERRLISIATAKQGLSIDAVYRTALGSDASADALVRALNRIDGVQSVALQRAGEQTEAVV